MPCHVERGDALRHFAACAFGCDGFAVAKQRAGSTFQLRDLREVHSDPCFSSWHELELARAAPMAAYRRSAEKRHSVFFGVFSPGTRSISVPAESGASFVGGRHSISELA